MNSSLKNQLNNSSVIIVIDSLDGYGAESQVLKLASGLSKKKISIRQYLPLEEKDF